MRIATMTVTACFICFGAAYAADAPKLSVDMTKVLTDWKGKPLKDVLVADDADCPACNDLTLGDAVTHAMLFVAKGDEGVDGGQRWSWSEIVRRVHADKDAQLSAKEAVIIGDRLLKVYALLPNGAVVIGAAMPLLDPNRKPPELK